MVPPGSNENEILTRQFNPSDENESEKDVEDGDRFTAASRMPTGPTEPSTTPDPSDTEEDTTDEPILSEAQSSKPIFVPFSA